MLPSEIRAAVAWPLPDCFALVPESVERLALTGVVPREHKRMCQIPVERLALTGVVPREHKRMCQIPASVSPSLAWGPGSTSGHPVLKRLAYKKQKTNITHNNKNQQHNKHSKTDNNKNNNNNVTQTNNTTQKHSNKNITASSRSSLASQLQVYIEEVDREFEYIEAVDRESAAWA